MVSRYNVMVLALLLTGKGSCKRSAQQDLEKYVAASTEDIARVFQLEKDLWSHLKEYQEQGVREKARVFETLNFFGKGLTQIDTDVQLL